MNCIRCRVTCEYELAHWDRVFFVCLPFCVGLLSAYVFTLKNVKLFCSLFIYSLVFTKYPIFNDRNRRFNKPTAVPVLGTVAFLWYYCVQKPKFPKQNPLVRLDDLITSHVGEPGHPSTGCIGQRKECLPVSQPDSWQF